jgi:hypothetical protein
MPNNIGGPITASIRAMGGLSGGLAKTPRTFKISKGAAHAATTNQTGKVLVVVLVI